MTTSLKQALFATKTELSKVASEIQKMAADIGEGKGTLGPDQVKEILTGVNQYMSKANELVGKAIEGIPSSQSTEDEDNPDSEDDTMIASDDTKDSYGLEDKFEPKTFKSKKAGDNVPDKKLLENVASLTATVNELLTEKTQAQKEKIATEFSNYWPPAMRKAKFDEIMKSNEDIKTLSARLDTLKSVTQTKTASSRDLKSPEQFPVFGQTLQRSASMPTEATEHDLILEAQ